MINATCMAKKLHFAQEGLVEKMESNVAKFKPNRIDEKWDF